MNRNSCDLVIVGAGISGLTAGRMISDAGKRVIVLDKGRGVGGRMATRRVALSNGEEARFDHGAQAVSGKNKWFRSQLAEWYEANITRPWGISRAITETEAEVWFKAVGGINAIPNHLSRTLDVRLNQQVTQIERSSDEWRISTSAGATISSRSIILTPPVPQSLSLIEQTLIPLPKENLQALMQIRFSSRFALLAMLEDGPNVSETGGLVCEDDAIDWITDNYVKGVSSVPGAITVLSTTGFAESHLDVEQEVVAVHLLEQAAKWLGADVMSWQLHRWRFSECVEPHSEPYAVVSDSPPLLIAGDGFGSEHIESAALSGKAAAEHLLAWL